MALWVGGWVLPTGWGTKEYQIRKRSSLNKVIPPKIANGIPATWDKMEYHLLQAGLATITGLVLGFVGEQENYVHKIIFCRLG